MYAEIEPTSGILRIWNNGKYGDPYDWSCTIRWLNPDELEIIGLDKPITKEGYTAALEACKKNGAKRVLIRHYHNQEPQEKWIDLTKRK